MFSAKINPPTHSIRIRLTAIKPQIEAEVIHTDLDPYVARVFPLGLKIRFRPSQPGVDDMWIIESPKDMPWFVLSEREGLKRFEHYR